MVKIAKGMLYRGTPIEDYQDEYGLFVKREDLACPKPGPAFSKTRGVYAHILNRREKLIGVLDTRHSQAGHAVARACQILGKKCVNFYPVYKADTGLRFSQEKAEALGASLHGLPAGRSCILFHQARKLTEADGGYIMPNALKLEESVAETAHEVPKEGNYDLVIIPISSGTIAAGVVQGFYRLGLNPKFIIHLGYSRSHDEVRKYIQTKSGVPTADLVLIDEGYSYADSSVRGETPPWPCNDYYDLKAFRWWVKNRKRYQELKTLFWNIG